MASAYWYIQSAFTKILNATLKEKGCYLTKEECSAIQSHHAIPDAIGNYEMWEFDENGEIRSDI